MTKRLCPVLESRRTETEAAWRILADHFVGSKAHRFIFGCAISSRRPNANGTCFVAQGAAKLVEPIPLLLEHAWHMPLGRVLGVEVVGDRLQFKAVIANSDVLYWTKEVWERIVGKDVTRISLEGDSLVKPIYDRTFRSWRLTEISVVGTGADDGAAIEKVTERLPFVYSDNRSSDTTHWSSR